MNKVNGNGESDRLPPHDEAAEAGLLGSILAAVAEEGRQESVWGLVSERIGATAGVFYDLRHQEIWQAMVGLRLEHRGIDVITLSGRLRDAEKLDQVGGLDYVSRLPDLVPSPEMAGNYLELVWEKYLARRTVQVGLTWARRAQAGGSVTEGQFAEMGEAVEGLAREAAQHLAIEPKNLRRPSDFSKEFMDWWFRHERPELAGWDLPWRFPLKIRRGEMTLFTGENGAGKSSMLGQIVVDLGGQGVRTMVASMEQHPAVTLWILSRQLLARGRLEETVESGDLLRRALAWLDEHVLLYNFLGITDWRELLHVMRWAAEREGASVFVVDSVMRIGIPDDDYATQGLAAAQFAGFAQEHNAHVFLVHHQNKSDQGRLKDKVRGSRQWTDNAHNVCGVMRNEGKAQKLEELEEELRVAPATEREAARKKHDEAVEKLRSLWDAKFLLSKQRFPGSQQNGSRYLWFKRGPLQFVDNWRDEARVYLKGETGLGLES
jgi:energy-coupling factor transporter ATP-binding protein EcfA2